MNARVENAPGARCASRYAPPDTHTDDEHRGDPRAVQRGEAEGGRDVEQQQEAEHAVAPIGGPRGAARRGKARGSCPCHRPNGHILQRARSLASSARPGAATGRNRAMSDVTTIEADVPERYADAVQTRLRRAADEDVVGRIWRKDGTLWAPEGTPEVTNRLGWLDIAERSKEQLAELRGLRRRAPARGLHRRRRARHGWIEPCAGGLPAVLRQGRHRPHAARAGLHAPRRGPEVPRHARPGEDARDRVLQVRRHDRADVDVQGVQRARRRHALRRRHRPRHRGGARQPAGFRRVSTATRTSAAATARSSAFGLVPAVVAGYDVAAVLDVRDRRPGGMPGRAGQRRPVAGRALGELAEPAATSSRSSPTTR